MVAAGDFVTMVEIVPPKGINCTKEIDGAEMLHRLGVDAINVPDSPRASARMSAQSLCVQIQQHVDIETILHYTCRDRNVLSIQSDLLGASSIGLKNILCLTGDPPKLGNYPDATAVFDVDAIGLVNVVHNLNYGLDIGGNPIGASTGFTIAFAANPGVRISKMRCGDLRSRLRQAPNTPLHNLSSTCACSKSSCGASKASGFPVIAGIWPLDKPAQRRVHEERPSRQHARRHHGANGSRYHSRGRRAQKASRSRRRCSQRRVRWCRAFR